MYPKSWEQRERWENAAKAKGIPLSKFLVNLIDEALAQSAESDKKKVSELNKENFNQSEEIKELKKELARVKKLISIQEKELEEYRNKAFMEKSFTGIRVFNRELIDTLRKAEKPLTNEGLLQKIGISSTDPDRVKAISAQLDALLSYEIVKFSSDGWRWNH